MTRSVYLKLKYFLEKCCPRPIKGQITLPRGKKTFRLEGELNEGGKRGS